MKKVICIDNEKVGQLKRDADRILNRVNNFIIPALVEAGFDVTKENISDALLIRREVVQGDAAPLNYVGAPADYSKQYEVQVIYTGCAALDAAFKKNLDEQLSFISIPSIKKEIEDKAHKGYDELRGKLFEGKLPSDCTPSFFTENFEVIEGKVALINAFNANCKKESTIYCESKAAENAMVAHEEAAKAINAFLKHFPKYARPDDLNSIFDVVDGEAQIASINYNKYL
ncbi:hypothetical protein [Bacteroides eggerthii]|uniref:hypothetical protein n=1 Tax=Bacteroides eggerthii TaxID=28111 RepID=UPI00189C62A1|nr:hypothetical protein [Bacteroides eggerthii]